MNNRNNERKSSYKKRINDEERPRRKRVIQWNKNGIMIQGERPRRSTVVWERE